MDMLLSGGTGVLGDAAGYALAPLNPVLGMAAGVAINETLGKMTGGFLDYRRAGRSMRQFNESTNLNEGIGRKRLTSDEADKLGREFLAEERNAWDYVPFGGGIAGRLRPETDVTKTYKKMEQMGLFRDSGTDVEVLKKQTQDTIKFMNEFASLAHTTREGILQLKATFNKLGFNDVQQNNAIRDITKTTLSTGMGVEQATQYYGNFVQVGLQSGFYNMNSPGSQGTNGLREMEAIKAGQEANNISRIYDPGTLAQQNFLNAANRTRSGFGLVTQFGHGNTMQAADELRRIGGGSAGVGIMLQDTDMFGNKVNPNDVYGDTVQAVGKRFGIGGVLSLENTREGRNQAINSWLGITYSNKQRADIKAHETYLDRIGFRQEDGFQRSFSLENAKPGETVFRENSHVGHGDRLTKYLEDISGKRIDKNSGDDLYKAYKKADSDRGIKDIVSKYHYNLISNGDITEGSVLKKTALAQIQQLGVSADDASNILNTMGQNTDRWNSASSLQTFAHDMMHPTDQFWHGFTSKDSSVSEKVAFAHDHTVSGFLLDQKDARIGKNTGLDTTFYDQVIARLNRKDGQDIVEHIAAAQTKEDRVALMKFYGLDPTEDGGGVGHDKTTTGKKFTTIMMAIRDWGLGKGGGRKAVENNEGMTSVYGSMARDKKANKTLASHGINSAEDYIKQQNQYGVDVATLKKLGMAAFDDKNFKQRFIAEADSNSISLNHGAGIYQALKMASGDKENFAIQLNELTKNASGQIGSDIATPGSNAQEANLDAIKKLSEACAQLAQAIAKKS